MTQVVKANMLRIGTASVFDTIRSFLLPYCPNKTEGQIVKLFKNCYWWVGAKLFWVLILDQVLD